MAKYIALGGGLIIQNRADGSSIYAVNYAVDKKRHYKKLGSTDVLTYEAARAMADGYRKKTAGVTCDDAFAQWLSRYGQLQTKTWGVQQYRWKKYISPLWGKTQMRALSSNDISGLLVLHKNHPTLANRLVQLVGSVWTKCARWGYVGGDNPCKHVTKNRLQSRTRYLPKSDLLRVLSALDSVPNQQAAAAFKLLIYTGCRKMEVLSLRWSQIDLDAKVLTLHNTKGARTHVLPLVDEAVEVLKGLRKTSPFVFPSNSKCGYLLWPSRTWARVLRMTKLEDVRIHDLRRTLGSLLAQDGESTLRIGDVYDHQSEAVTRVYARLNVDSKRETLERYASLLRA